MADVHPDIRPVGGLTQKHLIDLYYMIVASLTGICAKLDLDATVTGETYTANCITALIKTIIHDSLGNRTGVTGDHIIGPVGIGDAAEIELLYQIFNCFETLTEQLDLDGGVADTDYEANCYTAKFLALVEDQKGNTLGNGVAFRFRPGGVNPEKQKIDLFYNILDGIETLTEQLDLDGTITDTNYEALWYTAVVILKVENSQGNLMGN